MKITTAIVAALLLSLVVLSGCATQAPATTEDQQLQNEATPEQAASEASTQLVPENSEVEIGEML